MKISATRKIVLEEFPGQVRTWLGRLVEPINRFFEQVYFALSRGITIADNLKAQRFDVEIAENQAFPMRLSWGLNERPTILVLGYIAESRSTAIGNHSIEWSYDNGTIEVTFNGLDSSKSYKAVLVGFV